MELLYSPIPYPTLPAHCISGKGTISHVPSSDRRHEPDKRLRNLHQSYLREDRSVRRSHSPKQSINRKLHEARVRHQWQIHLRQQLPVSECCGFVSVHPEHSDGEHRPCRYSRHALSHSGHRPNRKPCHQLP